MTAIYEDLINHKKDGDLISRLSPISKDKVGEILRNNPGLPLDYLSFLIEVGYGDIGRAAYMLYGEPIAPEEIYGESSEELNGVIIIGDDMQGFNSGFSTADWSLVEIAPSNMMPRKLNIRFDEYIRKIIAESNCQSQ